MSRHPDRAALRLRLLRARLRACERDAARLGLREVSGLVGAACLALDEDMPEAGETSAIGLATRPAAGRA